MPPVRKKFATARHQFNASPLRWRPNAPGNVCKTRRVGWKKVSIGENPGVTGPKSSFQKLFFGEIMMLENVAIAHEPLGVPGSNLRKRVASASRSRGPVWTFKAAWNP